MVKYKIQNLKKLSYIGVSLLSLSGSVLYARENVSERIRDEFEGHQTIRLLNLIEDKSEVVNSQALIVRDDAVVKELEGSNLIHGSHSIFQIKDPENEWETCNPQGQTQYNLVGVALFGGQEIVSSSIKVLTGSKYSHVGVILADAKDENQWYCFESTGSASEVLHGHYPHVRLTDWQEVAKEYSGKVSYRLLIYDNEERVDSEKVTLFVKRNDGKSFTRNPAKLVKALLRDNKESKSEVLKTAFCSELTAKMFMDLGLLEQGAAGNYIPKDFSSNGKIKLASGVTLSPEFKVK